MVWRGNKRERGGGGGGGVGRRQRSRKTQTGMTQRNNRRSGQSYGNCFPFYSNLYTSKVHAGLASIFSPWFSSR